MQELYKRIPIVRDCKQCGNCCGHVPISAEEIRRLPEGIERDYPYKKDDCRFLVDNKCAIYGDRPFMCRTFGASESFDLMCIHGAKPDRYLSADESKQLCAEYRAKSDPYLET